MRYGIITALISSLIMTASAGLSEEGIFRRHGEMVFRPDSTTLCIVTTSGDTLVFADTPFPEMRDNFDLYSVTSYFREQNYWVLEIQGYELFEWLLLNGDNGREDIAISEPKLSPDGIRLLCRSADLEVGLAYKNGIQIWRIDEDSLALEFEDLDVPWEPYRVEWVSDSVIILDKAYWDWSNYEVEFHPGRLELSSTGNWIPDDPDSWE